MKRNCTKDVKHSILFYENGVEQPSFKNWSRGYGILGHLW